MPDTGFIRPSEVFTDDFGNAIDELTAGNGGATNTASGVGDAVELGDFTFGVPSGATINGIEFVYRVQNVSGDDEPTIEAKLRIGGTGNYGSIDSVGVPGTTTRTFGGPDDLLGLSPTSANINDLRYHIKITSNPEPDDLRIRNAFSGGGDFTAVKVYYTEASPAGTNTLNITSGKLTISSGRLTL